MPEEKKADQQEIKKEEPKAEAAKVETPKAEEPKVEAAAKPAAEKKEEKKKKEKPANCAACNKSIKKKRFYYRNGKHYCTKRCWKTTVKKEEKAKDTQKPSDAKDQAPSAA